MQGYLAVEAVEAVELSSRQLSTACRWKRVAYLKHVPWGGEVIVRCILCFPCISPCIQPPSDSCGATKWQLGRSHLPSVLSSCRLDSRSTASTAMERCTQTQHKKPPQLQPCNGRWLNGGGIWGVRPSGFTRKGLRMHRKACAVARSEAVPTHAPRLLVWLVVPP